MGALIIFALALLAYAIYRVGDILDVFAKRYPLITVLNRADGLLQGAPVTLAGQRVGQVKSIEFIPVDHRGNLSVRLAIDEDVRDYIRRDSYARVRTLGLLGDKYVDIVPGSPSEPVLAPLDTIPGIEPIDMEQLLAATDQAIKESRHVIENLRTITGSLLLGEGTLGRLLVDESLYTQMSGAASELRTLLAVVSEADGTFGRLIRDPTLYQRLVTSATRFDSLTFVILHGQGTMTRLLQDEDLYESLLAVIARADSAVTALGGTLNTLAQGDGTVQRLLTDPALYDQLLKAVIDLQILIGDIRFNPRRFRPVINVDIF